MNKEAWNVRFWKRIIKGASEDDCWGWIGTRSSGYGGMNLTSKRPERAHRLSWEIHFGAIPKGKFVLHRCDNRICANPKHLFLGTQADNMRDWIEKTGGKRGERHHFAKLTEAQVRAIREDARLHKIIAVDYGVGREAISCIKSRKNWWHIH